MTTIAIDNIKFMDEIKKHEYEERNFKEVNLAVFSNGVRYAADKLFMCFSALKKGYCVILKTDKGALVSGDFNSIQAESEFSFLSRQDSAAKKGIPTLINFFSYTFYGKNGEEIAGK
jgi:hypothetical protein